MIAKTKQVLILTLCVLTLTLASHSAEHESTFIGVTEPNHVWYLGEKIRTPFLIRVAFKYKNGIWRAMPNKSENQAELAALVHDYPKEIDWNLSFDGKKIGGFRSYCPLKWTLYSEIGLEEPDIKAHIPAIKIGAKNFHYWGAWDLRTRPLVASSGHYLDDPDNWKSLVPPPNPSHALISAYRKATKSQADGDLNPHEFTDKQILVRQYYKSWHGDELISLAVPSFEVKGEYDYEQWFCVRGNKISFLGSSLELIDAGDYDHDGHSEIVFHKRGYNYDAYVLVYEDLRKQLEFGWSYH